MYFKEFCIGCCKNVIKKVNSKEKSNQNIINENESKRMMATGGGTNGWADFDGYR